MTGPDVLLSDVLLSGQGEELARFGRFAVNGVVVGSVLALAGVGLTLVYGILRIANFAHGDFLTLGAYLTLYFVALVTLPQTIGWAVAVAVLLVALVAGDQWLRPLLQRKRINRHRRRPPENGGDTLERKASGRRLLSPTERVLILLAAGLLLVLVAGITFPVGSPPGVPLLLAVLVASSPVLARAILRPDHAPGLARDLGLWALLGVLSGVGIHVLAPLQTPGGLPFAMEVALGVGVFMGGLGGFRRALVQGRLPLVGAVLGGVVFLYLVADPILLALAISLAGVAFFMVVLEHVMWRRARRQGAGLLTLIIIAIGLMLALRNFIIILWGTPQQSFPGTLQPREPILGSAVGITPNQSLTVAVAWLVILLMHLFLRHTKMGKTMRAVADDMELARVSGINVDRVVVYVWIIAGVLAVLAGTLYGMLRPFNTNLGWFQILPIFAAVILGGIGSPYGAMLGGYTIGIVMEVSPYFGVPVDYKLVVAFVILILVMIFRPRGIMGGEATR